MSDFFDQLFEAIATWARNFAESNFQALWVVLAALAGIYLLTVILSRVGEPGFPNSREHFIRRRAIAATCIVTGILIAIYSYLWANTQFYYDNPVQFAHWLSVVACMTLGIILLVSLRGTYYRQNIKSVVVPAFSLGESRKFARGARTLFQNTKLWLLAPAIGFVMLLFYLNKPDYLLAVLIDNSSSMENNIENGKLALGQTIEDLDNNTDLIISWFTDSTGQSAPRKTMAEVQAASDARQLNGRHAFFEDHNQALQYLEGIELTAKTPLYETIHSQYLFARQQTMDREYSRRILIMVTDGAESYMEENEVGSLLCTDEEYDLFWDEVGIMNLGGDLGGKFYTKAMDECQYYVEQDATYLSSYQDGVAEMTREIIKKWYFPAFLIITYVIWGIACLLIRPKAY